MRNVLAFFLVLAVMPANCAAKPKHWFTDWKWWAGEAIIAGAIAADAHSTARGMGQGFTETNPLLGAHPSNRQIAGISLLNFGMQSSLHAGAWHHTHHIPIADSCDVDPLTGKRTNHCHEFAEDRLGWRIFGYTALPAAAVGFNGRAAARNYSMLR